MSDALVYGVKKFDGDVVVSEVSYETAMIICRKTEKSYVFEEIYVCDNDNLINMG